MKKIILPTCFVISCLLCHLKARSQNSAPRFCDKNITFSGITLPYYMVGTSYNGGLRKIKEVFFNGYRRPINNRQTGYCTLRFLVDCDGNVDNIETLACTKNFKKMNFNDGIAEQLIDLLNKLGKWNPGKIENLQPVVSQKYLTFIINEGNLVDIVPK